MASNLVVTNGLEQIIDLMDTVAWYIQSGIGTTNAAAGDTGLETITGCPAAVIAVGTQPTALTMRNVATVDFTSSLAITEAGVFNGSTGSGTDDLLQRHTFTDINVVSGDSIEFTIDATAAAAAA